MGDTKCTFGVRMPIDITMLNEMINREIKHFRNYKIYRPNFKSTPVSGKATSAHDQIKVESADESQKIDDYHVNVAQIRVKGPKSKFTQPVTENQMYYGWYATPLVPMNRNDRRFYFPQRESQHTKIQIIINTSCPKSKTSI